jgi:hypothetical protein
VPVYRTLNYERDYNQANGEETDAEQKIDNASVIPRINSELFRERKELGNCD